MLVSTAQCFIPMAFKWTPQVHLRPRHRCNSHRRLRFSIKSKCDKIVDGRRMLWVRGKACNGGSILPAQAWRDSGRKRAVLYCAQITEGVPFRTWWNRTPSERKRGGSVPHFLPPAYWQWFSAVVEYLLVRADTMLVNLVSKQMLTSSYGR